MFGIHAMLFSIKAEFEQHMGNQQIDTNHSTRVECAVTAFTFVAA